MGLIHSGELLIEISNVISDSKQDYLFFIDKHIIIEKSQKIAKVIFQNIDQEFDRCFSSLILELIIHLHLRQTTQLLI